jgi:tetratricopeptide (TPR) repeat protein
MRASRAIFCALVALLPLLKTGAAHGVRHQLDSRELERLKASSVETADLFAQGEAHLAKAELKEAAESFARVRASEPESALAARRHCQVLTELGRHGEAMAACLAARKLSHTVMDERAMVGAILSGDKAPSIEALASAIRLVQLIKRLPDQPFGDAALCEVAYRIGDSGMLKKCVEGLQRIAPDHYETRRWSAALNTAPAWPYWLGWGALALGSCATLAHAVARRLRPRARLGAAAPALLVAMALATPVRPALAQSSASSAAAPAPAMSVERLAPDKLPEDRSDVHWQLSSKFVINPDDPEKSVPSLEDKNAAPMQFGYYIQDLSSEAAYAEQKGDFVKAGKFWAALSKAVPDVAVGYRRACRAFRRAQDSEKALLYCSAALSRSGVIVDDYAQYGELMLAKPGPLQPNDIADLDAVVEHLRTSVDGQPDSLIAGERLACGIGVQLSDEKRLQFCTDRLSKGAVKDHVNTLFFRWNLAMLRRDYGAAKALLPEMKKAGMPAAALQKAEEKTFEASAWWRRPLKDWRYGAGLVALLAVAAGLMLYFRRNKPSNPAARRPDIDPAAAAG